MGRHTSWSPAIGLALAFIGTATVAFAAETPAANADAARGRYLVKIAGCNDCHTAGYALSEGNVPESEWLKGDELGWQGPWGTTYPINLRIYMQNLGEKEWLIAARHLKSRPPMPAMNVAAMSDDDLRAIYRYVRTLKPLGRLAPAYLPPGVQAKGPVVVFPAPPSNVTRR
jgi:mono/diheme cytochrome c family protein